jgi:arabinogalactan oligomer/maltooligosaccharide transport system permease protein
MQNSPQAIKTRRTLSRLLSYAVRYVIAIALILFAVVPAVWVVSASLNPAKSLASGTFFPTNPSLINYDELFNNQFFPYVQWLINSFKVAGIATIVTVFLTCIAGYALSRFRIRGKEYLQTGILILNVFPAILAVVALYSMFQQLGSHVPWLGLDTHGALIAIYISFAMGINVLLVKAYIDSIPADLDESALVDGATPWQTFRHVIFPMILPIVITVGVLTFIATYGDFVIARVLLKSADQLTVMVGINLFQTDRFDRDFGMISAGAVIAAIPIILLYFPLQRYVISGLTTGSIKG